MVMKLRFKSEAVALPTAKKGEKKLEDQFDKIASQFMSGMSMSGRLPLPLAMSYVPPQKWTIVYDNDEALGAGTLFPALDLPFTGGCQK